MGTIFNPSQSAKNNDRKKYGYVTRMSELPYPHEELEGLVVFCDESKRFYECQKDAVSSTETTSVFVWNAITVGSHRAYLIPVTKLTSDELDQMTSKTFNSCADVVDEIAYGLIRFGVSIDSIRYKKSSDTVYLADKNYYVLNLDYDALTLPRFKQLVAGTDYTVGDTIARLVFEKTDTYTEDVSADDVYKKLNEIIDAVNRNGASIDRISDTLIAAMTLDKLVEKVHQVIDEVNPYSVPWNVVLEHVDQKGTINNPLISPVYMKQDDVMYQMKIDPSTLSLIISKVE